MRRVALVVAVCVLLAGCATPFGASGPEPDAGGDGDDGTATAEATDPTPEATDSTPVVHEQRSDPETDRLGWENGYWHDDPVAVKASDGLNGSERAAVVARAMARVEVIRQLEFEQSVNVTVVNRTEFSDEFASGDTDEALRQFDNAKFEALFLIGTEENSIETQERNRNRTVAGFYSPAREAIVVVSDAAAPELGGERTLAHELVHALQDQQFNLSLSDSPRTRDAYNGRNGLIEGDARAVEQEYMGRCGETWSCLPSSSGQGGGGGDGGSDVHLGVYVLSFFPYSDGPGFVTSLRDGDDWSTVDAAFASPPDSSAEVIFPEKYGSFEPLDVALRDRNSDGWERVRPAGRPDYAVLGPSALASMFAYTLYDDYNSTAVVAASAFLNTDGGSVDQSDPFNYSLRPLGEWQGDRLHAYERNGRTGYVWRLAWASPAGADRFADRYRAVLSHWGGQQVGDGVWVLPADSPFTGAVSVRVEGDTVTVVRAPNRSELGGVYRGAG